ncbi:MAG: nicotinate phosphoribosyltransferase [Cyanobacteriota bacterium]|nr:nicotinate phosphoribosyltransferase [Cyanobacteriota bacterium]
MLTPELSLAPQDYGLLTDLYQLTMAACYVGEQVEQQPAAFELFVRRLPADYGYLMAMGLTQAVEYLQNLSFTAEQVKALQASGVFVDAPERFWSLLENCRFTGDLWAVAEGTAIFANEPLLRIEAPLWQAQLVETYLLSTLNYQTLIATKSARMRDAAGESAVLLEFGTRRAFGPHAGMWAARAALAAGFDATSNVLAALKLGRKPAGTMAHSLVMALAALSGDEESAFQSFRRYFPQSALLIDTYDPIQGARTAAQLMHRDLHESSSDGEMGGVRIDSGNLEQLSRQVQEILPQGSPIFVSGDLDEYEIQRLQQSQAPIAGYGVGTRLVTGGCINGVYKLVEINGIPVAKGSIAKATIPGRKQIFRGSDHDYLGSANEDPPPHTSPLLQPILQQGVLLNPLPSLEAIAQQTRTSLHQLPLSIRQLRDPNPWPVHLTPTLQSLKPKNA